MEENYWENFYTSRPLDEIPWQRTQADWFKHSIDNGLIKGDSALDLGCGAGKKSIYLAKNGFKRVVGIDVSKTAIKYAEQNALEERVKGVEFIVHDITDLSFLKEEKFDFILDWAALHCLDEELIPKYVSEIAAHTKISSLLMLRIFSKFGTEKEFFINEMNDLISRITLFDRKKVESLYGKYFEILESSRSKPRTKDNLCFDEYLMKRK